MSMCMCVSVCHVDQFVSEIYMLSVYLHEVFHPLGRPLNTYQPSKSQSVLYNPCAIFNNTEDYGKAFL